MMMKSHLLVILYYRYEVANIELNFLFVFLLFIIVLFYDGPLCIMKLDIDDGNLYLYVIKYF
jgi:hypothetical protein